MPRLTPLQWLLFALFLIFYGYAVFALTRDHYQRHPPQRSVAAQVNPAQPAQRTWIQDAMQAGPTPVIPLTSTDLDALGDQADALFGQQRFAEALPYYRRMLELDDGDAETYNALGLVLHYTGQSAEALQILGQGVERGPELQRIWLTLGFVRAQSGDREGARTALERARALGPDNAVGQEASRMLAGLGAD